ncbi:MAG: hypothetical protein Q9165_003807 [Trypethelium subeluteriae]
MSAEKVNELFWLTYGQAIKDKAGANLGSEGVFFLATEAQKGPPAGDDVPDEYTYQGLFDIGNNLLDTNNVFYNPSALHGYDEALDTAALQDQAAAQTFLTTQRKKAFDQFNEEKAMGLIPNPDFYDYVQAGKVPNYVAAQKNLDNISQTIEQIQNLQAGPMSGALKTDKANLAKGRNEDKDYAGYNMHGAMGNILSPAELVRKFQSGEKIAPPVFQRILAYNAPEYKQAVQAAMKKALTNFTPPNSYEFQIDLGKSTSDFNFGQTKIGGTVDISYGGWFSFSAGADHESSSETLDTEDESSQVVVKLVYDTIQRIPITPGSWNADVSKYKLRDDAPKNCKTLARVTDLVIATYLGYEITVGDKTASTIDTKMKETTSANGGIKVLGIPIGLSAAGSHSEEENTHTATWDNANKTLKILPTSDIGYATIVGVVGEKFKLAS